MSNNVANLEKTEEILRKNQELQTIFDYIPALILFKDKENRIIRANKATSRFFGKPLSNIINRRCSELFSNATGDLWKNDKEVIESGEPKYNVVEAIETASGEKWLQTDKIPYKDINGNVAGVICLSVDITEHILAELELRRSEDKYRSLVTNIPNVVWTSDSSGNRTFISPNIESILGYTPEDICEKGADIWLRKIHPAEAEKVKKAYKELFEKSVSFDVDYRIQRKDGEWIWVRDRSVTTYNNYGARYADGVLSDITKRKKTEEVLAASEQKFRDLTESTSDIIWELDNNSRFTYVNPKIKEIQGYEPQEVIGKTPFELMSEDNAKSSQAIFAATLAKRGNLEAVEHRILHKNGSEIIMEVGGVPVLDPAGNVLGYRGVARNITERKRTEEALKDTENKLRVVFDYGVDGIVLCDAETRKFHIWNKSFCQMLGYSEEELRNLGVKDIHPEKDLPYVVEQFKKLCKKEITVAKDIPVSRKDGTVFYADISGAAVELGGKTYIAGIFRDISERKEAQEKLQRYSEHLKELVDERTAKLAATNKSLALVISRRRQAERTLQENQELLNNVFESINDGILVLDEDFHYTYWNEAMERITGTPREEVICNKPAWEVFPDQAERGVHRMMRRAMEGEGETVISENVPYSLEDGRSGVTTEIFIPLRAKTGEICGVVGIVRDATEQQKAQTELTTIKEHFQYLLASCPAVIYTCEPCGNYSTTYISENVLERFGYTQEEFLSAPDFWANHIHPEDREKTINGLSGIIERGSHSHEYRFLHKNGEYHRVFDECKVIYYANKTPMEIIGSIIDITEHKKAEQSQ